MFGFALFVSLVFIDLFVMLDLLSSLNSYTNNIEDIDFA